MSTDGGTISINGGNFSPVVSEMIVGVPYFSTSGSISVIENCGSADSISLGGESRYNEALSLTQVNVITLENKDALKLLLQDELYIFTASTLTISSAQGNIKMRGMDQVYEFSSLNFF